MRSAAVIVATGVLLSYPLTLVGEDLFVLAAFDRSPDTAAVEHMRQETARIFADTGATLAWRTRTQPGIMPPGAVRVTLQLHGSCRVEPNMLSLAEDGPMGWVESHGGEMLSLIDVDCDRISAMVWQNRGTLPLPLVVRAFGRALGRVLAHELYHYVTQSPAHGASDLFRPAMTSRDLMLPDVRFEPAEIEVLRKALSARGEPLTCRAIS